MKANSLSRVRLCATPWTAAYQAPPSMGFSRQEYWSGQSCPAPFRYDLHQILGEGEGGKIWENDIETCKISCMKRVASPGSMHDTGCLGLVHWDDPEGGKEREEGGGIRMGNAGITVADSFRYLAKLIQYSKV